MFNAMLLKEIIQILYKRKYFKAISQDSVTVVIDEDENIQSKRF